MTARLVWIRGPLSGTSVELDEAETSLGRDAANRVVLRDSSVSRRHCLLRREGDGYRLVDLGSRHGSHVNGVACASRVLAAGDRVTLGRSAFVFAPGIE